MQNRDAGSPPNERASSRSDETTSIRRVAFYAFVLNLGLMLAATLVTFLFGQYALRVGRQTESPSLKAEGRHRHAGASRCLH